MSVRTVIAIAGISFAAACVAAASAQETPAAAPAANPAGQELYGRHCLTCHQADGYGVPNLQPAIVGGTWVGGDSRALAMFVLTGGFDSASRKESDNANVMPAFAQLSDEELAAILTFIRAKFGKGASAVTAADVADARGSLPK
jgi:mono/diheme cytochrome c family protein